MDKQAIIEKVTTNARNGKLACKQALKISADITDCTFAPQSTGELCICKGAFAKALADGDLWNGGHQP